MPTREQMVQELAAAHMQSQTPSREQMIQELAAAHGSAPAQPESDSYFGPGGKVPRWLAESPNARSLVEGGLEQAPIAGGIAGAVVGGGAGLVEGIPTAGTASIPLAAMQGMAGAGLGAGAGKAVENLGRHYLLGEGKTAKQQIVEPLGSAAEGAFYQGAGELIGPVAGLAKRGAQSVAKKGMTTFLGPGREAIDTYLMRPDAIKSAKSVEGIKDVIDGSVSKLFEGVEAAKLSKDEAKAALKEIEAQIGEASREGSLQFRIKQADIKEQMRDAQAKLDGAFKFEKEKLSNIKSPIHLADDAQAALQETKRAVSKLSGEAYDILGASKQTVNLQEPFKDLKEARKGLMIGGQGPITEEGQQALAKIDGLIERTGLLPAQLPAQEAKKLVQQLDNAIDYGVRNGAFTKDTQQALGRLRRNIDGSLKDIPGYSEKMKEVAAHAKMLEEASNLFGTPQLAVSKLNQVAGRTAGRTRDVLGALGSTTGRDFLSPVDEFVKAQSLLKDPSALEKIKRSLPEFKPARLQEIAHGQGQRPEAMREYVESYLASRGMPGKLSSAEGGLKSAEQSLAKNQEALDPFKSLSPANTQGHIKMLMKPTDQESINTKRMLTELGKVSEQDFVQMINDRRIANQFKGEYRNGSRNVVIFGSLFGSIHPGLIPVGVSVGASVDRFGPKMAQKILDGVLKAESRTPKALIESLDVPPTVKNFLAAQMGIKGESVSVQQINRAAELDRDSSTASQEQVPLKGKDKWANDGLEKVIEHSPDLGKSKDSLLKDPKTKDLLIQASDLKAGSKAMQNLVEKINARKQKGQK